MLELLLLTFFGSHSINFEAAPKLPGIEILNPAPLPVKRIAQTAPRLLSTPFIAVQATDPISGKTLFSHKADRAQGIASLTKLMTYLVIRENHQFDEVVTVPEAATRVIGAQVDLFAFEKLTVETLLEAILIPSANDAASALAIWSAGSEDKFVAQMNQKAKDLGLDSAVFYNASGLDIERPKDNCDTSTPGCKIETVGNLMSARDVMKLTRILLRDDWFARTVAKEHFYGQSVDEEFLHEKASTNQLFGSFVTSKGVKTGFDLPRPNIWWIGSGRVLAGIKDDFLL